MGAAATAATIIAALAVTGFGFVLKSLPYQTPQLPAPAAALAAAGGARLAGYPGGVRAVPVLAVPELRARPGPSAMTPARFATTLAALRRDGFSGVRLAVVAALARGERVRLPAHPVLITFDGGWGTDWTSADPIMRRYGFTATVFLDPARVAAHSPSYFLTRRELAAMTGSGRWDTGVLLAGHVGVRAASAARARLASLAGQPVRAYAYPVPRTSGAAAAQVAAGGAMARWAVPAVVLASPAAGPAADFVVPGSAATPLPRIRVTPGAGLPALAARLRAGVPAPAPTAPLALPWHAAGGTCRVTPAALTVIAHGFALCTPAVNATQWADLTLTLRLSAPTATAIIEARICAAGRAEIALGRSGLVIKQQVHHHWRTLARVSPSRPSRGKPGRVTITLHASHLTVRAGRLLAHTRLSPLLPTGAIGFGLAGAKATQHVTFAAAHLAGG